MKLYVASSWRNELQPSVVKTLVQAGHEVYDFRHPSMGPGARGQGFHWSEVDPFWQEWGAEEFRHYLQHPVARDGFMSDKTGLDWCEGAVLVMPCGRSAHLELGYALGAQKPAWILLTDGEPELMYGLATGLPSTHGEMLDMIEAWERDNSPLFCDCHPGCWGDHSKSWPRYPASLWTWAVANREHGTYVGYGDHIRLLGGIDAHLRVESAKEG